MSRYSLTPAPPQRPAARLAEARPRAKCTLRNPPRRRLLTPGPSANAVFRHRLAQRLDSSRQPFAQAFAYPSSTRRSGLPLPRGNPLQATCRPGIHLPPPPPPPRHRALSHHTLRGTARGKSVRFRKSSPPVAQVFTYPAPQRQALRPSPPPGLQRPDASGAKCTLRNLLLRHLLTTLLCRFPQPAAQAFTYSRPSCEQAPMRRISSPAPWQLQTTHRAGVRLLLIDSPPASLSGEETHPRATSRLGVYYTLPPPNSRPPHSNE